MTKGKLIVLYGINNLGKSTQAKLLVSYLQERGIRAAYLKYPLYDLAPSGPFINAYLREGNPHTFSAREFQLLQIMNRSQYDAVLRERLESGEWIIAEDYIGTGIAWGMGAGIEKTLLQTLNTHLVWEDCGILFQGKRFMEAREAGHTHETNDALTEAVRLAHEELGDEYGWHRIDANATIEEVARAIGAIIHERFGI